MMRLSTTDQVAVLCLVAGVAAPVIVLEQRELLQDILGVGSHRSTTLLATLYGLPISASHGVIGGLVAVGIYAHGPASLGAAPLVATVVAWVASPVIGGLTTAAIHAFICYAVHERSAPVAAAATLQPLLVMLTVTVAAAFLIVSGPAVLRVEPLSRGIAASAAFGLAVALTTLAAQRLVASSGTVHGSTGASWRHDRPGGDAISQEAGDTESCLRSSSTAPSEWREEGGAQQHAGEERPFVALLVLSALTVAFAHGANDLGNSIGPLAALLVVERGGDILARPTIPPWVVDLGAGGFVVGIVLLGSRTITTVGSKITRLTPSRSFAVQMGTAIAVLSCTVLGLAVSTSHCLVGAIIGVGVVDKARGRKDAELNMSTILKIVIGWVTTIPLAMAVSVGVFAALSGRYAGQCAAAPSTSPTVTA